MAVLVPPVLVTVTWAAPEVCAGVTAVICVDEFTVYEAAGVVPNSTAEAPDKPVNPVP